MEEIKIGEYIRFKDGKIRKIISQDVDNHLIVDIYIYGGNWLTLNEQKNILKHSSNIIDLIEVGDYVNGHKIINIDIDTFISGQINLWTNLYEMDSNGDRWRVKYIDKDIKSIVTKEQFTNIEYKMEE